MPLVLTLAKSDRKRRSFSVVNSATLTACASTYRLAAVALDQAKARLAIAKEELLEAVTPVRQAKLQSGKAQSVRVFTDDGASLSVVWTERYRALSADNIPALQAAFGDSYSLLCDDRESVSLAADTDLAKLEAAIGADALDKLMPLLQVKAQVVPRKGAYKAAADLYARGQKEMADDLLAMLDACAYSPSVRAK